MKYNNLQRLEIIIDTATKLHNYFIEQKISREDLQTKYPLQWLATTPLYNIGEQVYQLPIEFKEKYPQIAWNMIAGLRHRLVHNYEGTNWSIIVEVVFDELPQLIKQLKDIKEKES